MLNRKVGQKVVVNILGRWGRTKNLSLHLDDNCPSVPKKMLERSFRKDLKVPKFIPQVEPHHKGSLTQSQYKSNKQINSKNLQTL